MNLSISIEALHAAPMEMNGLDRLVFGVSGLFAGLTPRQREVVALMSQGLNNAGVARRLGVTEKSVKNYINALYQELGLERSGEYQPRVIAVLSYMREQPVLQAGS